MNAMELADIIPFLEEYFSASLDEIYLVSGGQQALSFTHLFSILCHIMDRKSRVYHRRLALCTQKLEARIQSERANLFRRGKRARAVSSSSDESATLHDTRHMRKASPPPTYKPQLGHSSKVKATPKKKSEVKAKVQKTLAKPTRPLARKRRAMPPPKVPSPNIPPIPALPAEPVGYDHIGPVYDYTNYFQQSKEGSVRLRGGGMGAGLEAKLRALEEESDESDDELTATAYHKVENTASSSHTSNQHPRLFAPGLSLPNTKQTSS